MDKRGSIPEVDPLLKRFLQSSDDAECERLLAELISNHASPLIKEAIWFKLHASSHPAVDGVRHQEAEDIHSEAVLNLVTRLRSLQLNPDGNPINNFRSYVAVVSYNACNEHLRRKYPVRHSLKNKLRYVLTHQPNLSIWTEGKDLLCGCTESQGRRASLSVGERIGQLRADPSYLERAGLLDPAQGDDLARVTNSILESSARVRFSRSHKKL